MLFGSLPLAMIYFLLILCEINLVIIIGKQRVIEHCSFKCNESVMKAFQNKLDILKKYFRNIWKYFVKKMKWFEISASPLVFIPLKKYSFVWAIVLLHEIFVAWNFCGILISLYFSSILAFCKYCSTCKQEFASF